MIYSWVHRAHISKPFATKTKTWLKAMGQKHYCKINPIILFINYYTEWWAKSEIIIRNGGPNPRSQSYSDPGLGISVKILEI